MSDGFNQYAEKRRASVLLWPVVITASAAMAVATALLDTGPPVQPLLVIWFLLVCPGMAFVRLLRLPGLVLQWILAIVVSIALGVVVSQAFLYLHYWSPVAGLVTLAAFSLVGVILQLLQDAGELRGQGTRA